VKTQTLEREESLRSRSLDRVRQELWGLHALMLIRNFWVTAWLASPGVLSRRLDALHEELGLLILPARRPRTYPRAVKIKTSNYPLKRNVRTKRGLN